MLIQCPECQFSRTLDESKVPPTAQIATCPRCKARFRFRNLDESDEGVSAASAYTEPGAGQGSHYGQPGQNSFGGSQGGEFPPADEGYRSDLPPTSQEDGQAGEKEQDGQFGENRDFSGRQEAKPRDIWDHIASLGEKWDQHKSGNQSARHHFQPHPEAGEFEPGARAGIVPWEHPERFGQAGGFFKTIMRVLMRGKLFFSSMPHNSRMARPLIFYFLVIALHFLISFGWIYLFSQNAEVAANLEQFNASMNQVSFLQLLVFIPINAALTLVMLGFTFSLLFRLSGIKNVSLLRNLRILCYASSGLVLVIIPIIGPIMSSLFVVFSTFQGFAYSYNIPPARAALLVFPVYLLLFLIVVGTSMSAM